MRIRRNITLFKLHFLVGDLLPLSALMIVYFQSISASYALALGVLSISNIVQSLAEIPTGIISDKMGRRRTMMTGSFGFVLAYVLFALAGNLSMVSLLFVGGAVRGIASAFLSGTDDAFMYETMQELRMADKYDILYARSRAFGQIGLACGAIVATIVTYFYSLNILAWVTAIIGIGHFVVTSLFVEPTVHRPDNTTSLRHFIDAWKNFIKNRKLRALAWLNMLQHGVGYTSHSFEGAYFNTLISTWMVNVARMLKQFCGTISYLIAPYMRRFGFYRIMIASTLFMTCVKFVSVGLNNIFTPFIQSCVNLGYGTASTANSALIQREFTSAQRATMGSIVSLLGGIVGAAMYFAVGIIADLSSVYFAIIFLIAFNVIVSAGYYILLKRDKKSQ